MRKIIEFNEVDLDAYGSDSEERNDLPAVALDRAQSRWGVRFAAEEVLVIGDTPRDVECGLAHGVRTVAVATGNFDGETLARAGAHHVLPDFSDRDAALEILAG